MPFLLRVVYGHSYEFLESNCIAELIGPGSARDNVEIAFGYLHMSKALDSELKSRLERLE